MRLGPGGEAPGEAEQRPQSPGAASEERPGRAQPRRRHFEGRDPAQPHRARCPRRPAALPSSGGF